MFIGVLFSSEVTQILVNFSGASGVLLYKSVPLGTMSDTLPYLARRAYENRIVLKGARRERDLLLREIKDRLLRKHPT